MVKKFRIALLIEDFPLPSEALEVFGTSVPFVKVY